MSRVRKSAQARSSKRLLCIIQEEADLLEDVPLESPRKRARYEVNNIPLQSITWSESVADTTTPPISPSKTIPVSSMAEAFATSVAAVKASPKKKPAALSLKAFIIPPKFPTVSDKLRNKSIITDGTDIATLLTTSKVKDTPRLPEKQEPFKWLRFNNIRPSITDGIACFYNDSSSIEPAETADTDEHDAETFTLKQLRLLQSALKQRNDKFSFIVPWIVNIRIQNVEGVNGPSDRSLFESAPELFYRNIEITDKAEPETPALTVTMHGSRVRQIEKGHAGKSVIIHNVTVQLSATTLLLDLEEEDSAMAVEKVDSRRRVGAWPNPSIE